MGTTRVRRGLTAFAVACGLLLSGAAACGNGDDSGGPGVPAGGEQGDVDGRFGNGGEDGAADDGQGEPGEGGAGDEIGGGG